MKNTLSLLIALACALEIIVILLRITWLYFPAFLQNSFIYKRKEPTKPEKVLYYLLIIAAMAYYVIVTVERIFLY